MNKHLRYKIPFTNQQLCTYWDVLREERLRPKDLHKVLIWHYLETGNAFDLIKYNHRTGTADTYILTYDAEYDVVQRLVFRMICENYEGKEDYSVIRSHVVFYRKLIKLQLDRIHSYGNTDHLDFVYYVNPSNTEINLNPRFLKLNGPQYRYH